MNIITYVNMAMNIITYVNMAAEKVQATSSEDLFSRFLNRLVRKHREPGFQGVNIKIKKQLGSGVFGVVYHGQIKVDPEDGSPVTTKKTLDQSEGDGMGSPVLTARGQRVAYVDVAVKIVSLMNRKDDGGSVEEVKEEPKRRGHKNKKMTEKQRYSRALEEAQNLSRVSKHPSIVTFVGARFEEDKLWLITEYCSMGNLNDYLQKGNVALTTRRFWYKQLLRGVEFLHRNEIGHFDLKPHNILLDRKSNLKIADFGISASVSDQGITILGVFKYVTPRGSLPYLAPEGFNGKLGLKADIFSLGLVYLTIAERPVYEIKGNQVFYYPMVQRESQSQEGKTKTDFVGRRMAILYNRQLSKHTLTHLEKKNQKSLNDSTSESAGSTSEKPTADSLAKTVGKEVLRQFFWENSTEAEKKLFAAMLRILPAHRSDFQQLKELINNIPVPTDTQEQQTGPSSERRRSSAAVLRKTSVSEAAQNTTRNSSNTKKCIIL